MNYFDLHCDTVTAVADGKRNAHISPQKAVCYEKYKQCFAIFLNDKFNGEEAFNKAKAYLSFYKEYIKGYDKTPLKGYLTLENGSSLGDNLNNIEFWKNEGVRAVTLTWNGENALGSGALQNPESGLKQFGFDCIGELERAGIAIDVSHLNKRGFYDCVNKAKKPFIASHSNCRSICNRPRNLTDEQIRLIIEMGGLIGICFYPLFLGSGDPIELCCEHIMHILELGGEDSLCFGSDFDGAELSDRLDEPKKVLKIYDNLLKNGLSEALLQKIFYKNADNFFNNVLLF